MQNVKLNPYRHLGAMLAQPFRLLVQSSAILSLVLLWHLSVFADDSSQTNGYFTALIRSECTSAPEDPPAVGAIRVGSDYVIMTVGRGISTWRRNSQTTQSLSL